MSEESGGLVEETNLGLMIAVPLFLLINASLAYVGGRLMTKMEHKSSEDVLTAHYLGGRSFGPVLSMGTMFASMFSGFTVIGLPNDAYNLGWIAFVWVAGQQAVCTAFCLTAPRLRKASIVRNHQSPSDFITDMFQSQLLRYAVIISQLLAQFIWMTSNVLSIKSAFNGVYGIPAESPWLAVGVVAFIVVSEWVGGLAAVALTDTVQGSIMILGTIAVACVIKVQYGGWTALDPETYYRPDFYQTPSAEDQWNWWQIPFLAGSNAFYPFMIQRVYSAKDMKSIKAAGWAVLTGPWLVMFAAIFMGTMGVQMIGDACQSATNPEECRSVTSPFVSILNILMSLGGFPLISRSRCYHLVLRCSRGIMSTTDSVLISMSQIVTTDILYPMRPSSTPQQVAWMGRGVSVVISALSLILAMSWKGSIILLFELGLPISMQMVPAFVVGLYFKGRIHPWSLAVPALLMLISTVIIIALYDDIKMHPGLFTFLLNVAAVVFSEVMRLVWTGKWRTVWTKAANDSEDEDAGDPFPDRPQWDKPKVQRFGHTSLSPHLMNTMMKGVDEPVKDYKYILFIILAYTITTPIVAEFQPPFNENGWTSLPPVVRGVPAWFFKSMIISFIINFVSVPAIISMPDVFPYSEESLLRSGIDADVVELEPEEKGGRQGYDEPNWKAEKRREMIKQESKIIKLANEDAKRAFNESLANHTSATRAGIKITQLVKDPSKKVFANISVIAEDDEEEEGGGDEDEFEDHPVVG